jgi:hypothetical protein
VATAFGATEKLADAAIKVCATITAARCRKADGTEEATALTALNKLQTMASSTSNLCAALDIATSCLSATFYTQAWGGANAKNATANNYLCLALTATTCRDTTDAHKAKAALAGAQEGRKSATDGQCSNVAAKECKVSGVNTLDNYQARTDGSNYACTALTTTTKCKNATDYKADATATANAMSWTSMTDSTCKANGKTANANTLCATGLDSGKTSGMADSDCYTVTQCKSAAPTAGLAVTMVGTNKRWTTATSDAACLTIDNANCRTAATGVQEAMGATVVKSWKSATDAECLALPTASCRCTTGYAAVGTRTNAANNMACLTADDCFTMVDLAAGNCAQAMGTS